MIGHRLGVVAGRHGDDAALRSASLSDASLTSAPRSLNELVTWRFSYLTKTSAPVSADSFGAGSIGVRSTAPAMRGGRLRYRQASRSRLGSPRSRRTMPQATAAVPAATRSFADPAGLLPICVAHGTIRHGRQRIAE